MARKKKLDKLSLDMIQCERDGFGVSYGRWKATQEPVEIVKIEIPDDSIPCPYCGASFEPASFRQKYCCTSCCNSASYQRRKVKIRERKRQRYADKKRKGA